MPEKDVSADSVQITVEEVGEGSDTCVLGLNRVVTPGEPVYYSSIAEAQGNSLAQQLLETGYLEALLLQENSITLLKSLDGEKWPVVKEKAIQIIEEHFRQLTEASSGSEQEMTAEEKELALRVQEHMNSELNPMVASHGGFIQVQGVKGETLYIHMGGGCQGCGMASVTLKQGVERVVLETFPEIKQVLDSTDHAAGTNPYYAAATK